MRKIICLLLFSSSLLLAGTLPEVANSFSKKEQLQLLKLFKNSSSKTLHSSKTYLIKKGWNQFLTPQDGINVIQTFENISDIKFVLTYDRVSKLWAGFTLEQSMLREIKEMLLLKYLEAHVSFFVLSQRDLMLEVKQNIVNETCQSYKNKKGYSFIEDSGLDDLPTYAKDDSIAVMPRYHSHFNRGFYDDTRILLIYPKIKAGFAEKKYGPADPFILLKYAKEYENRDFYIYDYLQKKCLRGVFPSRKMPPVPLLQELKI